MAEIPPKKRAKLVTRRLNDIFKEIQGIREAAKSAEEDTSKFPIFRGKFRSLDNLFQTYINNWDILWELYIIMDKEKEFPIEEKYLKAVRSYVYECNTIYENVMNPTPTITAKTISEDPNATHAFNLSMASLVRHRLPKISIPKFDGDLMDWVRFRDVFMSIVHNEASLTDIEKFHHLVGSLLGEPLRIVSSFSLSTDNYELAWKALEERYNNKRILAAAYLHKIKQFRPSNQSCSNPAYLRAFLKTVADSFSSLANLKLPDEADYFKLQLALDCRDTENRKLFEEKQTTDFPTYNSLIEFIQQRCKVLELAEPIKMARRNDNSYNNTIRQPKVLTTFDQKVDRSKTTEARYSINRKCSKCNKDHLLYRCYEFKRMPYIKKMDFVRSKKLCLNCLLSDHNASNCPSKHNCFYCNKRHHSLLHETSVQGESSSDIRETNSTPKANPSSGIVGTTAGDRSVLLGTATAHIKDWQDRWHPIRMVIDSGSQFSIITESCARRLGLPWRTSKRLLSGVGLTHLPASKGMITCTLSPLRTTSTTIQCNALVMPQLTSNLPSVSLNPSVLSYFKSIELADEHFWESKPIDFLLGSDLFLQILSSEPSIRLVDNFGTFPTIFGHVVIGVPPSQFFPSADVCLSVIENQLSDSLVRSFWEIEEVPSSSYTHPYHLECEKYFKDNVKRQPDGRYMVALPLRDSSRKYPESRPLARARLLNLEKKLSRLPKLRDSYHHFMKEYIELDHMIETSTPSSYVIPHHAVFKGTDSEQKIQVVFDASMWTPSGSLNENLIVGPKLQQDISKILMNFRGHRIVICADIVKMFRQILIAPEHRVYQHILWRDSPEAALKTYELCTLTYGQSSSPYLALRVLAQLVEDEGNELPMASQKLKTDVYVDDIITGVESYDEAITLKAELIELLERGCFPIHKWASNSAEFMKTVPHEDHQTELCISHEDMTTKVLGMHWNAQTDCFRYDVNINPTRATKRSMLSTIARLFDPLGFLAPVIFPAKQLIQSLWLLKLNWDDTPPPDIVDVWNEFLQELPKVKEINIPRWIHVSEGKLTLFGFCDASEKGYAAVIYLQVTGINSVAYTHLLTAKTRLAPKKLLTIPRLELCAAYLLTKLIRSLTDFCHSNSIEEILLFTDSTIVLGWLRLEPHLLKTFVANRIGYILTHTEPHQWHHVPSRQNPADLASRGVLPNQLAECALWWQGPAWLQDVPLILPETPPAVQDLPERKILGQTLMTTHPGANFSILLIESFSKLATLIRTLSYVFRFIHNSRHKNIKICGPLTVNELDQATFHLIRETQREYFQEDYDFQYHKSKSPRFKMLAVFEDSIQILRVGGRLSNSALPYDAKHPILLSPKAKLTSLLIDHLHQSYFHLGSKALQSHLSRKYYIFAARSLIRKRIWKCLPRFKRKANPENPFMADLPISRISQGRPFITVGVDYAGPFKIKQGTRRNAPISKAYLCLFVCMAVKAVHLELVSTLSTDAFLAAFDRFVARRGLPLDVHSDCGTNFVGAARELKELYQWHDNESTQSTIQHKSSIKGIQWHFNPPNAPHFGGLWEAAVKSAKTHLKRTLGDCSFHFEELTTIFTKIEAVMNSRPLCSVTSKPDDYDYLTPGHFLIGSALIATPERDVTEVNCNLLNRWQLIQNAIQTFWKRWSTEYIHTLQTRIKWTKDSSSIHLNDLVLIPDPQAPPLHWKLGRIVALHPGVDGVVRVVTIRTHVGELKRPVHKIVPLMPVNQDNKIK